MKSKLTVLFRYLILLFLILFSLSYFYKILTPLTIYPTITLLKIFFNQVSLSQNIIIIDSKTAIEIIPACISASAYLLLLILNLTTPMSLKKRICTLLFSFILLLTLNIFRITLFSILACYNFSLFDLTHKISWYFLSTIFVIAVWFSTVKLFKIKQIPVYSDIKKFIKNYQ